MYRLVGIICLLMVLILSATPAFSAEMEVEETEVVITPQTICPVMKGAIDKTLYVDSDGKRIYACCQGCIAEIKKDPEKYIKQLEDEGITLAETPPPLCSKCGEIEGSGKCCSPEGRTICKKCGLFEGSPGCCIKCRKSPLYCQKCGELSGTEKCCAPEGRVICDKCGMFEGSPCCCKTKADANLIDETDKFEKAQKKYEEAAGKDKTE